MLILFQLLFTLFALFAIVNVIKKRQELLLGPKGAAFWTVFWLGALLFVFWPDAANMIAQRFGIGRGTDFVLYVAIALIFFILFRLHVKLEELSRDVTIVVRKEAIRETESRDKKE